MKKSYALMESHFEVLQLQKSKTQKLIILLFSVFLITSIFPISDGIAQEVSSDNWTLHSEVDGVKSYYQITDCENESVVFLKFENTNNYTVNIEWDEQVKFINSEEFTKTNPFKINLFVSPGIVYGTNCQEPVIIQLVLRPCISDPTKLKVNTFRFENLTVEIQ